MARPLGDPTSRTKDKAKDDGEDKEAEAPAESEESAAESADAAGKANSDIPEPTDPAALAAFKALEANCARCHQVGRIARNGKPKKNFGNVLLLDEIVQKPNLILPGNPDGSKLFTQIAIRQLEAQGKISRDSTLGFYWPDYPNAEARKATIGQLLTHRAGLGGNIFGEPPHGTRASLRTNHDFLQLFVNEPLAFAPGTSQRYCNACYVVLGELVTRISGEKYSRYVARHILQPAGMTNLHGALDMALGFGGRGLHDKYYDLGYDTLYVLSDGAPTKAAEATPR